MKCAECSNEIEDEFLTVRDNYLEINYFESQELNIFCSEECLMKSIMAEWQFIDSEDW